MTTLLRSTLVPLRRVVLQPMARGTSQTLLPLQSITGPSVCSFSTTTPEASAKGDISKPGLVKELVETHALKKSEAAKILNTVFDKIVEAVADGQQVKISSFGTFERYASKATTGRNPHTQENIQIPSKFRIRFKPYKSFKNIVHPPAPKA